MSDSESLRTAWAATPPTEPGPDCATPDTIWEAVAGSRPEHEVQAMLAHNLGCADCSALWRLARELSSAGEEDASPRPAEVTPLVRPRPVRWWVGGGALAAAALVALALLPRTSPRETSPVVRGAEELVLRPDPAAEALDRGHPVLRWTGVPEGSRYTVVVSTRDLTVLYRRSGIAAPQLEIPPEALAGVPAGGEIVWRVEAIVPGGRRVSSGAFLSRVQ